MLQQAQLPSPALQSSADLVSSAAQANNPAAAKDPLMEKAKEFEAVFLNEMLQNMFTGLDEGGTYGNSEGSDAWRSMLVNEYANTLSESGGIGIAASVHSQLLQLQENAV